MAELPPRPEGIVLAHFIVSDDVERSARFYTEVLGGRVVFSPEPTYVELANTWIIINGGGGPTDDKPAVTLETPRDPDRVSSFLNIRVKDIQAVYSRGVGKVVGSVVETVSPSTPVSRPTLRVSDGDDLDLAVRQLAIDQRVGESPDQGAPSAVEQRPASRRFEDSIELCVHRLDELRAEPRALGVVPDRRLLELRSGGGVVPKPTGHGSAAGVGPSLRRPRLSPCDPRRPLRCAAESPPRYSGRARRRSSPRGSR
jgi:catechol 2,3-dioxygenase-like lactoylglutathione lyase family enzyme